MNPKKLVKISNTIGAISIVLLIYWVFVFITIEVFGLKVFKENITQTFYLSIVGILSLMFGALIINIMFNLTRIAQKHNKDVLPASKKSKMNKAMLIASFPVIAVLLFGGDYLTSKNKEKMLIRSAEAIVTDHAENLDSLLNYSFSLNWLKESDEIMDILSKTDQHFPNVTLIVRDSIKNSKLYLGFRADYYYIRENDTILPTKRDFILKTTQPERDYLHSVFNSNAKEIRFSAHDGSFELSYPYKKGDKRIVLYFSDHTTYGKIGS